MKGREGLATLTKERFVISQSVSQSFSNWDQFLLLLVLLPCSSDNTEIRRVELKRPHATSSGSMALRGIFFLIVSQGAFLILLFIYS